MVSILWRRQIPIVILIGFFGLHTINYFFGDIGLQDIVSIIDSGGSVIVSFTIIVACITFLIRSLNIIINWRKEGGLKIVAVELLGWFLLLTYCTVFILKGTASPEYTYLDGTFLVPAQSGIWLICCALPATCIFAKYRIRNLDGAIFVGAFAFLILARSPAIQGIIPGLQEVASTFSDIFFTPLSKVLLTLGVIGTLAIVIESLRGRIGGFD